MWRPLHLDGCLDMQYFSTLAVHYSPAWERCCRKHEKLCAEKTCVLGITWLSIALTTIKCGKRKWIWRERARKGCCDMNLLLKESRFLQPRGGHYFLVVVGLTLCYIDSRRDCGKGLCCEASSREGLGKHLEQNKRKETYNSRLTDNRCTVKIVLFPDTDCWLNLTKWSFFSNVPTIIL